MKQLLAILIAVLACAGASAPARAQIPGSTGTNVQDGSNRNTTNQQGNGKSGASVGGQVSGVVSGGRTSVDARNSSKDSSVQSGNVNGTNSARSFTGLNAVTGDGPAVNLQTGDNTSTLTQTAAASSGDGVAGQVIGAVTAPSGSTSIVADNTSTNNDVTTGDARSTNSSFAFVGLNAAPVVTSTGTPFTFDDDDIDFCVAASCNIAQTSTAVALATATAVARNTQNGDNRFTVSQSAPATSGDGVAGQVIGSVSAGATSIDARNTSTNNDVTTGDANSSNTSNAFVGLNASPVAILTASQTAIAFNVVVCFLVGGCFDTQTATSSAVAVSTATATNNQTGDNRAGVSQSAPASTGDGVAGEVIGAVTSAGGSTSIVAANNSDNNSVQTGDAHSTNASDLFVGLKAAPTATVLATQTAVGVTTPFPIPPVSNAVVCIVVGLCENTQTAVASATATASAAATNTQDGNNRARVAQSAPASSGDGVAGQVIGSVSGGATSIDARNTSTNNDVSTGDADSSNTSDAFVGLEASPVAAATASQTAIAANVVVCIVVEACIDTQTATASAVTAATATATNDQTGDNRATIFQSAPASSGDGVAGEVIGAVTTAGGSASIVAANTSDNNAVDTGNADSSNTSNSFVGLNADPLATTSASQTASAVNVVVCFVVGLCENTQTAEASATATSTAVAANVQDGDNRLTVSQSAPASSGDGVAGQVIGAVSAGAASIDARNTSTDNNVTTGDTDAFNISSAFVGLEAVPSAATTTDQLATATNVHICAFTGVCASTTAAARTLSATNSATGTNVQEGANNKTVNQLADASSGDAVAGQVTGVVTSTGGSASVVVANTSSGLDATSGQSRFGNSDNAFVGLNFSTGPLTLF